MPVFSYPCTTLCDVKALLLDIRCLTERDDHFSEAPLQNGKERTDKSTRKRRLQNSRCPGREYGSNLYI